MASLRASFSKGNGNGGGGRHPSGRRGGGGQLHDQQQHRFPPLHSQNYWHHSQQHTHVRYNNTFIFHVFIRRTIRS